MVTWLLLPPGLCWTIACYVIRRAVYIILWKNNHMVCIMKVSISYECLFIGNILGPQTEMSLVRGLLQHPSYSLRRWKKCTINLNWMWFSQKCLETALNIHCLIVYSTWIIRANYISIKMNRKMINNIN